MFALYRRAIDMIHDAGLHATIENEVHGCLLTGPREVEAFFARLDRAGRVTFTWDVQNMWQMGTYPSLDTYHQLKPLIGLYHLKGGRSEPGSTTLAWRATLEQATWPVLEITRAVVADGVSPVICINPSHGTVHPDYSMDNAAERDVAFLRRHFG